MVEFPFLFRLPAFASQLTIFESKLRAMSTCNGEVQTLSKETLSSIDIFLVGISVAFLFSSLSHCALALTRPRIRQPTKLSNHKGTLLCLAALCLELLSSCYIYQNSSAFGSRLDLQRSVLFLFSLTFLYVPSFIFNFEKLLLDI